MGHGLSNKIVKTRKSHMCFSCLRYFPLNTLMEKWSCIYEREFNYGYTCLTCIEIHKLSDEHEFPGGFVRDWLERNETPEQLLKRLKDGSNR